VKAEVERVGDPRRVWLGGNSMGGPAAFHALMDKRMPRIGGFITSSGTIDACTKPDKAKASMPIYFYTPGKEDVYPKSRTQKRIQDFRHAGFTNIKNTIVPDRNHGSNIVSKQGLTEFGAKMLEGLGPIRKNL
jgi:dienelactone hydrolase